VEACAHCRHCSARAAPMGDGRRSTWVEGTSSDGRDTTRLGALFAPSTRSDGTAHVDFCTMPKGRFGSKSVIWRSSANVVGATQPRLTTITNSVYRGDADEICSTHRAGQRLRLAMRHYPTRTFAGQRGRSKRREQCALAASTSPCSPATRRARSGNSSPSEKEYNTGDPPHRQFAPKLQAETCYPIGIHFPEEIG